MKLQFSLATLLVCVTVLAVVCAVSAAIPIHERREIATSTPRYGTTEGLINLYRRPTTGEIALRIGLWGTPAIAATLGVLWAVRRLKSRRHTEPPAG